MYIKNAEKIFSEDDLFYCYSEDVKNHIEENGIKYIYCGKRGSGTFWIFLKSDKLLEIVDVGKEV